MVKKPTTRFTPEPEAYEPRLHWHVWEHDVTDDPQVVSTHTTFSDAVEGILRVADQHLDNLNQMDNDALVRPDVPITAQGQLDALARQVSEFDRQLAEDDGRFATSVRRDGFFFSIDGGIRVIDLGVCIENCVLPETT